MFIGAVVSALVLGYFGGLVSFKVKSRWCPGCGAMTRPHIASAAAADVNQRHSQ
ncbi:hypothetical protein ABZS66_59335 [Dactylosporangium sp. NPDC005572]|uniref:hypothetical protein n=1 Tax=Dactylosporangium sp. NPDC005572 TaxID=3156889 RepID=UPI0033A542CD